MHELNLIEMLILFSSCSYTLIFLDGKRVCRYDSLGDVVLNNGVICMPNILHERFVHLHPETVGIINHSNYSTRSSDKLLAALEDESCAAIILSDNEFEAAGRFDADYCTSGAILRDNVLLDADVIIPFGSIAYHGNRYNTSLNRIGYDKLIAHFNQMVQFVLCGFW